MLTVSGRRQERLALAIWPAVLKARSEGTEVAGRQRYFFARRETLGNLVLLRLHQVNGLSDVASSPIYLETSM